MMYMQEEEKLARDVYIKMYEIWGAAIFSNISVSEQRHMDAVLKSLVKCRIPDPVSGNPIGFFTNSDLQKLYTDLVAQGQLSLLDAYLVGRAIEEKDIRDLQLAVDETSKTLLDKVYGNLLRGSFNHLRSFNSHIDGVAQWADCVRLQAGRRPRLFWPLLDMGLKESRESGQCALFSAAIPSAL